MKALLCKAYGPPETLALEEVPSPQAGEDEVVLDIKAASVNFPDVLMLEDKYQFHPPLPFAPGSEVAGIIRAAGAKVKRYKTGDKVIGSCGVGGFAEQIALKEDQLLALPDGMAFDAGAAFLMAYGTSYHALKDRARLQAGEVLVVLGAAGGVGLAAVELGRMMGAKVIAAASSAEKCALAKAQGAHETILYSPEPLDRDGQKAFSQAIKQASGGEGADVVYDPAGGTYSEPALRACNWNGRFLVVGFTAGIPKIPLNLALLKGVYITGVFWGAFRAREPQAHQKNLDELARFFREGKLKPHISKRFPLSEGAAALRLMADRKALGKIVVQP